MASFHTDIQTLLQDISDDYGEAANDQLSLPYSTPNTHAYYPQSMISEQTPPLLYDQQLYPASQAFDLPDTYPHHIQNTVGLDAYGNLIHCRQH